MNLKMITVLSTVYSGPEPTSGDLPTEDKKQMFMEEIENIPPIKYSNKDNHRRLNKALYGAAYLLGYEDYYNNIAQSVSYNGHDFELIRKNKPMEFYNEQIVPLSVIKKTFCKSLTSSDEVSCSCSDQHCLDNNTEDI